MHQICLIHTHTIGLLIEMDQISEDRQSTHVLRPTQVNDSQRQSKNIDVDARTMELFFARDHVCLRVSKPYSGVFVALVQIVSCF